MISVRMTESYEGVVEYVFKDEVTVLYEVDGSIMEQTYNKKQFINNCLPDIGARLIVTVSIVEVSDNYEKDKIQDT